MLLHLVASILGIVSAAQPGQTSAGWLVSGAVLMFLFLGFSVLALVHGALRRSREVLRKLVLIGVQGVLGAYFLVLLIRLFVEASQQPKTPTVPGMLLLTLIRVALIYLGASGLAQLVHSVLKRT